MDRRPTIFISAGEASGDLHGAGLASALAELCPGIRMFGIGGDRMAEAGVKLLAHNRDLAVVGLVEVLRHARPIIGAFWKAVSFIRQKRPDLVVLIDFPDFNFLLGERAKASGAKVFYYICPQVWAWRQGRAKRLARFADALAVILPFEEAFYRERGLNARFVGHPLLDSVKPSTGRTTFLSFLGLQREGTVVALLPGSRSGEIRRHAPIMLEAARRVKDEVGHISFLLPLLREEDLRHLDGSALAMKDELGVKLVTGATWDCLHAADLAIAASGTVTLEAAVIGTPVIVTYKVSPLTYHLGKRLIKVKFASLVNLIAGQEVVPELLQHRATPEKIAAQAISLLESEAALADMRSALARVREQLGGPGACRKAARLALETAGMAMQT